MPLGATICHETIDFLFIVDRYAERAAPAWTQLLARAVLSGVVLGEAPAGILTEAKADWLLKQIGNDRIADPRSLELIARVIARSESSPAWLRELLVELSRPKQSNAPTVGARQLQAVLAESLQAECLPVPQRAEKKETAEVVPIPAPFPVAMPIAVAA